MEVSERIIIKASELFTHYGIHSVTMDDIATHAGISKKTIYLHYPNKNALVEAVIDGEIARNMLLFGDEKYKNEKPIPRLILSMTEIQRLFRKIDSRLVHDLQKYQPATFYKLNEYKSGYLYNMLKQNIECGIQQELFRKDFDVDVIVKFFLESMSVISNTSIFPSVKYDTEQVTEEVFKHFLNGLLTLKGIHRHHS